MRWTGSFPGLIVGGLVFGVIGCLAANEDAATRYRTAAIEHGCAQYSPTTGEFEWKGGEAK